jgi:hypothetical protein
MQQENEQVGLGDPRELPQKLRAILGNRFISDPLPTLNWGALLLRAFGFRAPSAEEARLLEGFIETNMTDQAEMTGLTVAAGLEIDISLFKSTGGKEEFRGSTRAATEKIEIFALQKSKTFVAVVRTEARGETVKEFIKKLWTEKLKKQITPEREEAEQRETDVTNKKRKETDNLILIPDDDGDQNRGKKMTLMQKIPILAEISEEAFKHFSTEVQQYQSEWGWTNSIAFSIKAKVEKLWNMGKGAKWSEADKETKVEFLSNMQEVIRRAAGQFRSERIMIEDPMLRWSEGAIDWDNLAEQIEEREYEGQANCRAVTQMFKNTNYYIDVQREMSTIRKADLEMADPLLLSISMAKRAVQLVDQEGKEDATGAGSFYGLNQSPKSWYDTHQRNFKKKIFLGRGNGAGIDATRQKGKGDIAITCFKCGGVGHLKKDCPSTEKKRSLEEVVCFVCGLKGHYASTCPTKMQEEEDKEDEDKSKTPGKAMQTRVTFQKKKEANNAVTAVKAADK